MQSAPQPFGNTVYDVQGQGPPLLLLNGLGYGRWSWSWQWDRLPRLQVVLVENRGIGGSSLGDEPFTIADLADDAARVLDHLGLPRVVVWGVSLGGMIAQEFALRYPHRTAGLILGCTFCGGAESVPMSDETREHMTQLAELGGTPESIRGSLDLSFSPGWQATHPLDVERFVEMRSRYAAPLQTWTWQREAALRFDASARLRDYSGPALLLQGGDDPVVPPANMLVLRSKLSRAEKHLYPNSRHVFWIENADHTNALVEDFAHRCWSS
jgi:3-oxoadipate enol-lactonase